MSHVAPHLVDLDPRTAPPFPQAALPMLRNPQLRKNVAHAIDVIQSKRAKLVAEKTDWQELRSAAAPQWSDAPCWRILRTHSCQSSPRAPPPGHCAPHSSRSCSFKAHPSLAATPPAVPFRPP